MKHFTVLTISLLFCTRIFTGGELYLKEVPRMASCLSNNYLTQKLIAYKNNHFIGDIEYTLPTGDTMFLSMISVSQKRQGHGRAIINELKKFARERGIKKITCKSSDRNLLFHEKCGAVSHGIDAEAMNCLEYPIE